MLVTFAAVPVVKETAEPETIAELITSPTFPAEAEDASIIPIVGPLNSVEVVVPVTSNAVAGAVFFIPTFPAGNNLISPTFVKNTNPPVKPSPTKRPVSGKGAILKVELVASN